jgi:hypothetical protein
MRKLVLKISVSADGFLCAPNGEIDWLLRTMNKTLCALCILCLCAPLSETKEFMKDK